MTYRLCQKCKRVLNAEPNVFRIDGLNGYFCEECAAELVKMLGLTAVAVINLPYYTD